MVAGARHVAAIPPAAAALVAIGLHRFCYGVFTLMTLLLYRNTFADGGGIFPGGILGLGQVVAAAAVGSLAAAAVTPPVVRRIGTRVWIPVLLVAGAAAQVVLGLLFTTVAVVLVGVLLGFVAQGVKICVDSTLQETVEDDYRGRVFSVYDTLFNLTFVVALVVGAATLPESGVSTLVPVVVAGGYLLAAVTYFRITRAH
jgi:MFS family permease